MLKDEPQRRLDGFRHKTFTLVILVHKIANGKLGQLPVDDTHIYLRHKLVRLFVEYAHEKAVACHPIGVQFSHQAFGFLLGLGQQNGVARFEVLQVIAVSHTHSVIHRPIAGLVAVNNEAFCFKASGAVEQHLVHMFLFTRPKYP